MSDLVLPSELTELVREYDAALAELQQRANQVMAQRSGVLTAGLKMLGLKGEWNFDGTRFVRKEEPKNETPPPARCADPSESLVAAAIKARDEGDVKRALRYGRQALLYEKPDPNAYTVLAGLLGFCEKQEEALAVLKPGIARCPEYADIMLEERAFQHLRLKHWEQGWQDWEHRAIRQNIAKQIDSTLKLPEWRGEPLNGKTLLVVGEGGIGDGILYSRYLPLVKDGKILFVAKDKVLGDFLLDSGLVWDAVSQDQQCPQVASYWIGQQSLPLLLSPTEIPRRPDLPVMWNGNAGQPRKRRIGIYWGQNDGVAAAHKWRPYDLQDWKALFELPDVEFVSLQLGETPKPCVSGLQPNSSLLDTARVIAGLDYVVTGDGIIAHLAGLVRTPTSLVLHRYGFWPWERCEDRTVWYPDMKVYHQTEFGWSEVFWRVARDLTAAL